MGAGQGKRRRAQASRVQEWKLYEREDALGKVQLESRELDFQELSEEQIGIERKLLRHVITMEVPGGPALARYGGERGESVILQTHSEMARESISASGPRKLVAPEIALYSKLRGEEHDFPSREKFISCLDEALRQGYFETLRTDKDESFAFVPAVGDDGYEDGKRLILLLDNPDGVLNLREQDLGRTPSLSEYSKRGNIYLTLPLVEAKCLAEALAKELVYDKEYEEVLRRRELPDNGDTTITIPDLGAVSF